VRIALVTQEEPFYLPTAVEDFCKGCKDEIVGLIILPAFNEDRWKNAQRLYEFFGPVDFSRLLWRFGWAKLFDKVNQVKPMTRRPFSSSDVAKRHNVRIYEPKKINAPEFVEVMKNEMRPDLLVSMAASQILKQRVLDVPKHGCINLHSAPLPRYQGMMPNFWTMMHGDPEAWVTVHYMVEKLDAGDILLQKSVPIETTDSLHDLMIRSKQVGVQALLEAIEQIKAGTVQPKTMDASQASYFSFPKRADARKLRDRGHPLL
jgi:methionyl-tRNA formyltransferase